MRVLFLPGPAVGHAYPMVPLAWAFRAAGHEVTFVTGGDGLGVAQAGLPVLDALPGQTTAGMLARFGEDVPILFEPVGDRSIHEVMHERKPYVVAAWDPYVDSHVALSELVRPELVVYDPIFAVGPVVAARLGVPAVAHGLGFARYTPDLLRDLPGATTLRRYGVELPEGIPTVDNAPQSLVEGPPSELGMRFVPYNGSRVVPEWLLEPPARPRIVVTFGSLGGPRRFAGLIKRLAVVASDVDVEFLLTADPADVPVELPPNIHVVGWVPLSTIASTCAAVIHHGGDSTALTCGAFGVRQMAVANFPDERASAETLHRRGAAHLLRSEEELDAAAIHRLLADDELRRVTAELKAEIDAMPAPAELVPRLTALV